MSNMSYCRFRNTRGDLSDCLGVLTYREADLSNDEYRAAKAMFGEFIDFLVDEGVVDEDGVDLARLGKLLESQRESGFEADEDEEGDDDE